MAKTPNQTNFIFLLYFLARVAAFPLLVLYFLNRGLRDGRYFTSIPERLGHLPQHFHRTPSGAIWLHAVSVGEVLSAIRLVEEIRKTNPAIPLYLSTTTLAGRSVAEQKAAHLLDGIFYAPLDYAFAVRSILKTIRPAAVVVLETEIWPSLYRQAKETRCKLLIVNGRISDQAFPQYRRLRWFFEPVLTLPDHIFVQSEGDRRRYLALGAPPERVHVLGNLKYDATPVRPTPPPEISAMVSQINPRNIWIAASTMAPRDSADVDEDDIVIQSFQQLAANHPRLLLILVPRKPERFAAAAAKLQNAKGSSFLRTARFVPPDFTLPGVMLLDTIGELASLFPLADVVFMGGTLARRGGHNVLEPAACANPIVVGPHMENFADIASAFRDEHAWIQIPDGSALPEAVDSLLRDPARRAQVGMRAAKIAAQSQGTAVRAAAEILSAQDLAIPDWHRPGLSRPILAAIADLRRRAGALAQTRDLARSQSLASPVISIGGISIGGIGKTPFVELLAARLRARGPQPAILTRGHRRRSLDKSILIPAGADVSTWYTGDEAQIFVRAGNAHIGIGDDPRETGRLLEEKYHPDLFLLDDGFQHRRLRRDLDIVLIDALDPFPGFDVFPLGRLLEPLGGLPRAHAFVITRLQPGRRAEGIRQVLRQHNPHAPIFLASVGAREWLPTAPNAEKVAAFCGLRNPAAFWNTLHGQGFHPVFTWTFGDRHHYRPHELRRLAYQATANGASVLLTTEKDAMNLPENAPDLVAPLTIHWLKITTVVEDEERLIDLILEKLHDRRARHDAELFPSG